MPMTRKRCRELEAEAGVANNSAGTGSAEMDTLTHAGKWPKQSSKVKSKRTPGGKGKVQPHQRNATRSDEDGEQAGPSKPPTRPEPIAISSSPLSLLTDFPNSSNSPPPQTSAQKPSPIFEVHTLPCTPCRQRVENRQPDINPSRNSVLATDSDEWLVPTSQSQDLRPFLISPPHTGGSARFKDTTPKLLRQSQGYNPQPVQPLRSVVATIQARGHVGTQETDIVPSSQMEEAELQIPDSVRAGASRSLAFGSSDRHDYVAQHCHERAGVLRTPTKITGLPRDVTKPTAALLFPSERGSPTRRDDDDPSTSQLPPSSIPLSTHPQRASHYDPALDFVQYQPTPTKRKSSFDSPREKMMLFESQATLSPTWSEPRSFEEWRFRDVLDSRYAFGGGKAGLEAEAEGHEPGGSLDADGEESQELEETAMMASSMTQPESQDFAEWIMKAHPELRFVGKAPSCKSGNSSPTREHDESQSGGLGESVLISPQPSLEPLHAFLDIFGGASSLPQDPQL